jgi:Pectate lyase superfamily protein
MTSSNILRALIASCAICTCEASASVGADMPWTTYEAEGMRTTGLVLGPRYEPNLVETESSGQKCVKLVKTGEFLEFTAAAGANALVIRYSLPDAKEGGGTDTGLDLYVNGVKVRALALTSRYSWLYGGYPFSNLPSEGKPRNFYDELRVKDLTIGRNDVIRLQRSDAEAAYCIVDLVDLEDVPKPLPAPENSLSVLDFGADQNGKSDATSAMRECVAAAQKQGRSVWVPAGSYKLTGEILVPSSVTVQGAGMWHTTFVGDDSLYDQAARRVRFKLAGRNIHLADFSIIGRLNYRNDNEPNDGIVGAGCADSSVSNVWLEHTKVGIWIYNGVSLVIEGCRFRDLVADGVNLCVGTSGTVIQNCTTRGTGDDCFAIWPAASDQGFVGQGPRSGNNVIRRCTGQLPFLANGAAIYGGASNRIEDCRFTDIGTGCGILVSTTFPTSDEALKIDNNFSGTTLVRNCELLRCGGYDHSWGWRGSLQICMDRRSISGITISHVTIQDSISSGMTVVAPGGPRGEGILSDARFEMVNVANSGIGGSPHHDLWIRGDSYGSVALLNSAIADIRNESEHFSLLGP